MEYKDLIAARYSVRKFDKERDVPSDFVREIIDAGLKAPTAVNFQPFHIWVISDEPGIKKASASNSFPFFSDAKVLFVIGADPSLSWKRKYDGTDFAPIDASIVTTQMMLRIHDLGLGSTWIGSFDPEVMKTYFPEMRKYDLYAMLPVAYPAEDASPSERHSIRKTEDDIVTYL